MKQQTKESAVSAEIVRLTIIKANAMERSAHYRREARKAQKAIGESLIKLAEVAK